MNYSKHRQDEKQDGNGALTKPQTGQESQPANVHWVSHEAVGTGRHELPGRIEDRRRSASADDEHTRGRKDEESADPKECKPEHSHPGWQFHVETLIPDLHAEPQPSKKEKEHRHVAQCPERKEQ